MNGEIQERIDRLPTLKKALSTRFRCSKLVFLPLLLLVLCSHDLYFKMSSYFLQPNQQATLSLYNSTFEASENLITRDRMLDASIVGNGARVSLDSTQWTDQDSTISKVTFRTGDPGTYVAGVSTKARNIELTAEKFNSYLAHDGILDMLQQRKEEGDLAQDAVERYEKHVKAIFQVGDQTSDDWNTELGYPIEFVPQANPYEKFSGEKLAVQLLLSGKPLANELVYANYVPTGHDHLSEEHQHGSEAHTHSEGHKHEGEDHSNDDDHAEDGHPHSHDAQTAESHTHTSGQQLRTNEQGIVTVDLPEDGIYYLRTIHMTQADDSDELTHRSKWATLTFEVTHKHDATTHSHDHEHEYEEGIPTWGFVLGSVLIIGLFFMVFRKKD